MSLSKDLTIVIPCKNEGLIIKKTLGLLNLQNNIKGVNVMVADSSTDNGFTQNCILHSSHNNINVKIVKGGFPSEARNNGTKKIKTPYVLFLDADIFITDLNLLSHMIEIMENNDYHLSTTKMRTDDGHYNYVYKSFDIIQHLTKSTTPFAVGGFMLFNLEVFNSLGGFNPDDKFAEDYHLSSKITPNKFYVDNKIVYTTSRRFKNKGLFYMVKMMIKSWFNRNNDEFFTKEHNYWN
jgi:glycosyltransferase involved in cell wall biosynthesis